MRYLLLSDIHGSLPALRKALRFYREHHCGMLVILGDILNYGPRNGLPDGLDPRGIADELNAMADEIVAIRGNCDSEVDQMLLRFPIMSTYSIMVDEGRKYLLTHGHVFGEDHLPPGRFDAVVTGHTHLWHLEERGGTVFCNTGSITFPKGGNPPTLCLLEHHRFTVCNLDGHVLKSL